MRLVLFLLFAIAVAVGTGLGSAWVLVGEERPFGAVKVGEWAAWPLAGSAADADPYARAWAARTGEIPLGAGEGMAFTATRDSVGRPLVGTCDYELSGETAAARLWTLTVLDKTGDLAPNPAGRTGFHSRELLRAPDGRFEIKLSPFARAGNWMPTPAAGPLQVVLRLYDTPLALSSGTGGLVMPRIVRGTCR
ncbi:DUF1214 domain-containing protein [Methyloraptor flagellatus]|uniref:DUF1214 domain-containing protein n=1 Tax=Methyloraptor flagellatus TaxID=3162530 RepID=A0AAU7X755_9HYPH